MIISLRGTNGSGKSTVIRALMEKYVVSRPIYGVLGPRLPEAYALELPRVFGVPTYVLGPYITECGGCDRIIPFDLIPQLVEKYARRGHVVFEGIIVGTVYGQVGTLMEKWGKDGVFLILDTTLEECIRRVEKRRAGRGDDRPFNPQNLTSKFKQLQRVVRRAQEGGILRVETVSDKEAPQAIVDMLKKSKWKDVA